MFFNKRYDKIFKLTDGVFTEYTGRLDTSMIKSYNNYPLKDRNGLFLRWLSENDTESRNSGIINEGFIEDFESYC